MLFVLELTLNDLTYLKSSDGNEIFNLTEVVSSYWKSIGEELGVSPEALGDIEVKDEADFKKMEIIWKMWLDHKIDKYPPTDIGLVDLLKNIKVSKLNFRTAVALKYTQFKHQ